MQSGHPDSVGVRALQRTLAKQHLPVPAFLALGAALRQVSAHARTLLGNGVAEQSARKCH